MAMAARAPGGRSAASQLRNIAVMIVDDSAVVRGMVSKWINDEAGMAIVGTASNGDTALREQKRSNPDVIILDVEMPGTNGLKALPLLLKNDPNVKVIMASSLTEKGAKVSLEAMRLGASDFIQKPTTGSERSGRDAYRRMLMEKVAALAGSRLNKTQLEAKPVNAVTDKARVAVRPEGSNYGRSPITLRKVNRGPADIIAIGSSTGGPQALSTVLQKICSQTDLPIVVTQHMPRTFTGIFAEHLNKELPFTCREGQHGEPIAPKHIYLAPGDQHMVVANSKGPVIQLNTAPPENFCRPAVDPLFRSVAEVYRNRVVAAILTGMGHDGLKGAAALVAAGGNVIAQDEATSVVWGMPGAAATGGVCCAVLPLEDIGRCVVDVSRGKLP